MLNFDERTGPALGVDYPDVTVPDWYRDAKLGVFIHWGIFSLPAWAEPHDGRVPVEDAYARHRYAEWYGNTVRIPASPCRARHVARFGEGTSYEDLADRWRPFDLDADAMIRAVLRSGARYVVPVTKHHDGFCLWDTATTSFNAARLLGPGAAGILIALIGSGWVFVVNAVAYLVHACCLLRLDSARMTTARVKDRQSGSLLLALRYVAKRADLALLLTIAAGMGAFGFNFSITNPLMATQVFGKGAGEFGALGSVMGIGSLTAALLAARRRRPRIRHVAVALGLFAGCLAASALSPTFWAFTLLMVPLGWTSVQVMVTANALIQMGVEPRFRGRVMALWSAMILGLTPIVSPVIGQVGAAFGARATVWLCAGGVIVLFAGVSAYLLRSPGVEVHMTRRRPWLSVEPRSSRR